MKKFILISLLALGKFSQAQSFYGIPIKGSIPQFVSNYKAKGFTVKKINDLIISASGKMGFEEIEVYGYATPITKQIFKIVAYFPEQDEWEDLKSSYMRTKQAITDKYGEPDDVTEIFEPPYEDGKNDGSELGGLSQEKIVFRTIWARRANTNIMIEMTKDFQLKLTYENAQNMYLKRKEFAQFQNQNF